MMALNPIRFKVLNSVQLLNVSKCIPSLMQRANIISMERKDPQIDAEKPAPYPWKTRRYTYWHSLLHLDYPTISRFDENSKIICIEGNKSCGKHEFAQKIAKEFGMLYLPEPNLDELYINHRNFDYRSLNHMLPERVQAIDEKMFYANPHHKALFHFQFHIFVARWHQYIDALAHLYSTGQGVVIERSPWSAFTFTEAMYKNGYLPKMARDYMLRIRWTSIWLIQRPHLIIYLDVPADKLLEKIKKNNRPEEVKSPVFANTNYLKEVEHQYKNVLLPDIVTHSEVLIYDWTEPGDFDDIVEDIERMDMENYDYHFDKMQDWNLWADYMYDANRRKYCNPDKEELDLNGPLSEPDYDMDEIMWPPDEAQHQRLIYEDFVPGYNYYPSFDPATQGWKAYFRMASKTYREWGDENRKGVYQ